MSENFKILTRKYGSIQETALIHYRYQGSFFAPSPAVAQIIYTNVIGNLYTDICPILDRIAEGVSGAHFPFPMIRVRHSLEQFPSACPPKSENGLE